MKCSWEWFVPGRNSTELKFYFIFNINFISYKWKNVAQKVNKGSKKRVTSPNPDSLGYFNPIVLSRLPKMGQRQVKQQNL